MDIARYRDLLAQARRLCRSRADAEDLLQDALLAALKAGRDDAAWLAGVLRQQAAMSARTAIRRRRREAVAMEIEIEAPSSETQVDAKNLLQRLPPAARRLAVLALHGLNAEEVRWILGITPAAFRQRLTSIRQRIGSLPPMLRGEALALAYVRDPTRNADLQFGLLRRALKAALGGRDGLATHDADGHRLILRRVAHSSPLGGN